MGRALAWLRNAVLTVGLVARGAAVSLRYNWGLGLLSVVLALSLWFYVTDRENPERTGRVPGAVPVEAENVPSGLAVFSISPESVTVRARAPESVLEELSAEDFRATVDLRNVTGPQASVEVAVGSTQPRAEVESVSPSQVTVRLEDVTSRTVPVQTQLVGAPPRGFEARETVVEPDEAVVTGPESLVRRVATVEADINLTGVRTDFEQTLLLQARDEGGGTITGLDVEPESVLVQVEIAQVEYSATFIVRADVSGVPAEGYNVTAIQVEPAVVVVTGSAEAFQSIDPVQGVLTEEVSIDGATADVVRTVALRLPEDARADQPAVTVRISIALTQGQSTFTVVPRVANLASGLDATLDPTTVQVVLAGTLTGLGAVDAEDIVATVDLEGLEAGEHTVPVRVQAPTGTTVVTVVPVELKVRLRPP